MNYEELTSAICMKMGIPKQVFDIPNEKNFLLYDGLGLHLSEEKENFIGIRLRYKFLNQTDKYWNGVRLQIAKSYKQNFINQLNEIFKENELVLIDLKSDKKMYEYLDDGFLVLLVKIEGEIVILDFAKPY